MHIVRPKKNSAFRYTYPSLYDDEEEEEDKKEEEEEEEEEKIKPKGQKKTRVINKRDRNPLGRNDIPKQVWYNLEDVGNEFKNPPQFHGISFDHKATYGKFQVKLGPEFVGSRPTAYHAALLYNAAAKDFNDKLKKGPITDVYYSKIRDHGPFELNIITEGHAKYKNSGFHGTGENWDEYKTLQIESSNKNKE